MKACMHRTSRKAFLGPLIVLPLLCAVFFTAVSLLTIRSWGFSVAAGVVVFFASFIALAVVYVTVDPGGPAASDGEVDQE